MVTQVAQKETLSRGEMLKQAFLKEQKRIQQEICKVICENPKTVPEIAEATGMPSHEVLWYLASFKKYGIVVEDGMCGDYPLYRNAEVK
jgi:predicted transcriptional regulator